jgi:hypothetical protein
MLICSLHFDNVVAYVDTLNVSWIVHDVYIYLIYVDIARSEDMIMSRWLEASNVEIFLLEV